MKSEFENDALQQAIDASLKRRFAPPSEFQLDLPTASPRPAFRLVAWRAWLPFAALAAAVLLVVYFQRPPAPELSAPAFVADASGALEQVSPRTDGTSVLLQPAPIQPVAEAPDLERLYAALADSPENAEPCASPTERMENAAERANMLLARYGDMCLEPAAAVDLQGPFSSNEWPSGTVFKGVADGHAVVVVAEHEARASCCLHVDLPKGSELSIFTWRCGNLRLTEITPLEEPRLLQLFGP